MGCSLSLHLPLVVTYILHIQVTQIQNRSDCVSYLQVYRSIGSSLVPNAQDVFVRPRTHHGAAQFVSNIGELIANDTQNDHLPEPS